MTLSFRKITGQLHLWLGLVSGLVVLVVTVTGALMVFREELEHLFSHKFYYVEKQTAQRLPLDELFQRAAAYDPSIHFTRIEIGDASRTVILESEHHLMSMDPYTGRVIEVVEEDKMFFVVVLHLHRYLLAGPTGKVITGISCLIFVFLVFSGIVLWWPQKWKNLKQRLKIKSDGSNKRFIWDLHAVGGFYVHILVFTMAFTGLTWSYKWFNNGIFLLFDGKPQVVRKAPPNKAILPAGSGFYEDLYAKANQLLPYKGPVTITVPASDSVAITISKLNEEASIANVVDFVYYEKGTGRLLEKRLYKDESTGMKVRRLIYPIHTGSLYGWPTKLLALIGCGFATSLPVTGLLVWLGRKKKKKPVSAKKNLVVKMV